MLKNLSEEALIDRYTEIGKQQDDAQLANKTALYNRLYWEREAIELELKTRGPEARFCLLPLLAHRNIQVRLNAAIDCLAFAPVEARAVLQQIRDSRQGPQCLNAGMTLWGLDKGTFVPT